ncbi:MAG: multiheme c-type cytochrome [bacterium]
MNRFRSRRAALALASAAALLAAGVFLYSPPLFPPPAWAAPAGAGQAGAAQEKKSPGKWRSAADFAKEHWRTPVPPMGEAPASYKNKERSLLPEDCGSCHPDQYKQWKTTLHAGAMSPGFYGQTVDMWRDSPGGAQGCNECHAPLAEQQKKSLLGRGPLASWAKNPAYSRKLEMAGLTCAACHVRAWRVHGPPKPGAKPGRSDATSSGEHGGVERTPFFERSEFCMGCHQFTFGGPNGKAIQNTYNEWKASLWAKEGVQCQNCHMPKRAHLWRGIHDREMAQGAVTLDVELDKKAPAGIAAARIVIKNTGAGHYFPTYITPSVDVIAWLEDKSGRALPGTRVVEVIERKLSADFSREIYDKRIPPQKSFVMNYRRGRPASAARLRVRVRIRPDAFYLGFFTQTLRAGGQSPKARKLLEEAKRRAENSPYDIFDDKIELDQG